MTHGASECHADERYDGADMHYYQRFAPSVGFHQGDPALSSHGCIHLSGHSASTLWSEVGIGTRVIVCAGEQCQRHLDGVEAERRREAEERRQREHGEPAHGGRGHHGHERHERRRTHADDD